MDGSEERKKNKKQQIREPFHYNKYYHYSYNGTTAKFYDFDVGNENKNKSTTTKLAETKINSSKINDSFLTI